MCIGWDFYLRKLASGGKKSASGGRFLTSGVGLNLSTSPLRDNGQIVLRSYFSSACSKGNYAIHISLPNNFLVITIDLLVLQFITIKKLRWTIHLNRIPFLLYLIPCRQFMNSSSSLHLVFAVDNVKEMQQYRWTREVSKFTLRNTVLTAQLH